MANAITTTTVDLLESLSAHVEAARRYFDASMAPETQRSYSAGWRAFTRFCEAHGLTSLPAEPQTVSLFATETAQGRAVATVRAYLAAVSAAHREAGHDDPTKHEAVRRIVSGIRREHGTRSRQAKGLTENDVSAIRATLGGSVRDLRDWAMVLVARDLLARRSELAALDVADLDLGAEDGTALIRSSKTDQEGEGHTAYVGPEATAALRRYMGAAGVTEGAVFRAVTKGGNVRARITPKSVGRAFKRLAEGAGLDADRVSGHSARVGMAQDLAAFGASTTELQTAGRWQSPTMPAHYSARQRARRSAVARFHDAKS
jgi:integrase